MPPGEVVAVCKKMHAPDLLSLPLTFMLRFIPAIRGEFGDVFDSLRMRGLPLDTAPRKSLNTW